MTRVRFGGAAALAGLALAAAGLGHACTGIQLKSKDGAVITARTMEFGADMQSEVVIIPRGKAYTGTAPGGKPGLRWTTKYGAAGMNGLKLPQILDGCNEKGLGVGLFYFPDCAGYQAVPEGAEDKALAPWELATYLLTTCANVEQAVKAARDVLVGPTVLPAWQFCPPAHFRLHDASGKAAVLEYVGGKLKVYDNPLGVITNAPEFDWHLTNLRNYVNLSAIAPQGLDLGKVKIHPLGQGSGMVGLPGDFTPPARFVRAVAFSQSALPVEKAEQAVKQAFHILNNFDIPKGAAREKSGGKITADFTQWTSTTDLTNRKFYFRTYANSKVRVVSLKAADLDAADFKYISTAEKETFEDVTEKAK